VSAVFLVRKGRVRLRRNLEEGATVAVHTALAGDSFAEAALFAEHYHCDAVAEVASVLHAYPVAPLRQRLTSDPQAAFGFARFMAAQVRDLRWRVELRNVHSAESRVMVWLEAKSGGSPPAVPSHQPWTEIAHEIGLTRETLYPTLARLEAQGCIRREKDRTRLLHRHQLPRPDQT
jgi:CRP-like cAMP-binding protein